MLNPSSVRHCPLPLKTILTLAATCAAQPRCNGKGAKPVSGNASSQVVAGKWAAQRGVKPHRVSGTLELLWKLWRHESRPQRRVLIEEHICRLCRPLVATAARSIHRDACAYDMDDLMQEGFIALLSCLRRYQPGSGVDFAAYVPKRVRGAMLDAAEKSRRCAITARHTPTGNTRPGRCVPIDAAECCTVRTNVPQWMIDLEVAHMLEPLSPLQRHIVIRCVLDGQNTRSAAQQLGIHASTVSRQLRAALTIIRHHTEQ